MTAAAVKTREPIRHRHRVCFYETDAMGVVHHSNYLRFFEEARMHWYLDRKISHHDIVDGERVNFAVVEAQARYKSPARYTDEIEVTVYIRQERSTIRFEYIVRDVSDARLIATGYSVHVPVNKHMKICRISADMAKLLKEEPWIEI